MLASLLGGFAPLVASGMLAGGGPPVVLGLYAGGLAVPGTIAQACSPETKNRSLSTSD